MTYKELIKCPHCGHILTTTRLPRDGEVGAKYCYECNTSHPFDVYTGEPIAKVPQKQYEPRELVRGQICEYCGKTFDFKRKRATCPDNNNQCAKMLAGQKARDARMGKK